MNAQGILMQLREGSRAKSFLKPEDILSDFYLTPLQKYLVLEAMLSDLDDTETPVRQNIRDIENIKAAKILLKEQFD